MITETDPAALFTEATQHHAAGHLEEAEKLYRTVLSQNPNVSSAHNNLGMIFEAKGVLGNAEKCFRNALIVKPNYPEALNNLGALLRRLHHYDEAIEYLRRALELRPDNLEALLNLAGAYQETSEIHGVIEAYERALALDASEYRAYWGLAQFYADHNMLEDSIAAFSKAAELEPESMDVRCGLVTQRHAACDWLGLERDEQDLLNRIRDGENGVGPFLTVSITSTPADQLICAQFYAANLKLNAGARFPSRAAHNKIRLGYVSCDFREHPVSNLAVEMFERHDRSKFEVTAYSYGDNDHSPMRSRLESAFDRFHDCHAMSDPETARLIESDEIDILIDLTGYTRHARTAIFASRPAPVQVNYLGYPGTMGAGCIDYIVADHIVIPQEHQQFYSEKIAYLPNSYQAGSHRDISTQTPEPSAYGLPDDGFIFCCFNKTSKLRPGFFAIWMRLLRQVPGSVLWLLDAPDIAKANLCREAAAGGVSPERLVFAPRLPLPQHLARHRLADLFLDTLPYNAHTTMSDALWAGLPAITCLGETFAGRVGGSILQAAGLGELIATTPEAYENLALNLATNPHELTYIQKKLRSTLATMPLFNCAAFTRDIEQAYSVMWNLHSAGRRPETITVTST